VLCGYPVLCRLLASRAAQPGRELADALPSVAIIVPVYNEEEFIRPKLENLAQVDYPADRITSIVVDNGSTDMTAQIAREYPVVLLQCERGKNKAINTALERTEAEIVIITDVDVIFGSDAVKEIVSKFADDVGAVSGLVKLQSKKVFYIKSKLRFHRSDWELRYLEGLIDTCCSLDGRLLAFRRSLVPRLPDDAIIDDLEITFLVRQQGFRCVVDRNTPALESCPETVWAEIVQIRRRVCTTLVTMARYWRMIFNPRYGFFGMVTQPFRRVFALTLPVYMAYCVFFLAWKLGYGVLWALLGLVVVMIVAGEAFPILQSVGIVLGWVEIILGRVKPGGVWQRIRRKSGPGG